MDETVAALCAHSRRGRPPADLALILFALRLPVGTALIQQGLNHRLGRLREGMESSTQSALERFPPPDDPELRLAPEYERAEALARLAVDSPTAVRPLRQNLRRARLPRAPEDLVSVTVRLFQVASADEVVDGLDELMYALGLHGLLEQVSPELPPLLEDGPDAFVEAARQVLGLMLQPLPADVDPDEVAEARDLVIDVARAYASAPQPELMHFVGGPAVSQLWNPGDLDELACVLSGAVHIRRLLGPLNADPILEAVRSNGWPLKSRDAFVRG